MENISKNLIEQKIKETKADNRKLPFEKWAIANIDILKRGFVVAVFLVFMFIFFRITYLPFESTFNVTVDTERILFKVLEKKDIYFHSVIIHDVINDKKYTDFDGRISLNPEVSIELERVANGAVSITFEPSERKSNSVGEIYSDKNDTLVEKAGKLVKVFITDIDSRLKKGESIIFSIDGEILELGKTVSNIGNARSIAVLKGGEVKMIQKSFLVDNYYVASSEQLYLGDGLIFYQGDNNDDIARKAFGFVTITEKPGMSAAYRIIAEKAKITKPGPSILAGNSEDESGYFITVAIVDIFLNDPVFQMVSIIAVTLLTLFELIGFYKKMGKDNKNETTI